MKNEHALRFLLLRHFNIVQSQIPADVFERVSQNLHIEMQNKVDYKMTWDTGTGRQEKILPESVFRFYERGDINPENRSFEDSLSNTNDQKAREITQEIFGRTLNFDLPPPKSMDPFDIFDMAADAVFLGLVIGVGEMPVIQTALLAPLFYWEYLKIGRAFAGIYLTFLASTAWVGGVLAGAPVFAVLQFLDPSPHVRLTRAALGLLSFIAAGLVFIKYRIPMEFGLWFWITLAVAAVVSGFRILFTCNHRSIALMLPFFCAGLMTTGFSKTAVAGLCYAAANVFMHAYGFRFIPFLNRARMQTHG